LKELFNELFSNKNKTTKNAPQLNEARSTLPNYIDFK